MTRLEFICCDFENILHINTKFNMHTSKWRQLHWHQSFSFLATSCLKTKLTFSVCQWSRNSNKFLNYFILTVCHNHVSGNSVLVFVVVFCSKTEGFSSLLFFKCAFNWYLLLGIFWYLAACDNSVNFLNPFSCRSLSRWSFGSRKEVSRTGKK